MRSLKNIILVASFLLLPLVEGAIAAEFTYEYQRIVEVEEPLQVNLNLVRGKVSISGSDDGRVVIEAVKKVRASNEFEAEEVADHIEIKVDASAGKLDITTNYLKILSRSPSFWQKVLGAGSDSYGSVDYRITLPVQSSVEIVGMAADIELSSIEGEIEVTNTVGVTRGEFLFGPVTVQQPQGEIELRWIEGDIRVKSSLSAITIQQVRGAIDLTTSSGDVNIQTELDSPRDYFVETTSGAITFSLPKDASGRLSIGTESGEIQTEVPIAIKSVLHHRIKGEFGQGGPSITLSSSSGDVTVALY
jgi:DUF4097 and DUF4098 domain-containing protein YvlB